MQKPFATSSLMNGIIEEVPIHQISSPSYRFHTRQSDFCDDDNIDELALSIKQNGLLNPIIVRTTTVTSTPALSEKTEFKIVTGNRRYIACKKLGLRKIVCQIVELDEKEAFEVSLVENIQRRDLDPLEEGKAFKAYVYDFGWGGLSDLSSKISKSISYISKRISLLDLPSEILDEVKKSNLSTSVAEELIYIKDKEKQLHIAQQVLGNKISVAKMRMLIKEGVDYEQHIANNNNNNTNSNKDNTDFITDANATISSSTPTNAVYIYEGDGMDYFDHSFRKDTLEEIDFKAQRAFDKTISTLKIALAKIGRIIEDVEDNWIVYETLMQHKNMINNQIDVLIKEKKKL